MKEIKDDINRWGDIPCSWVGRINIVNMTILPNAIYRFNEIPIILLMAFFHRTRTKSFTVHMETQKTPSTHSILRKKNGAGGISPPDSDYPTKATVIKTVWYRHRTRNTDQWNKTESPEINP